MPLLLHKETGNGEFGIWEISEETDQLYLLARLCGQDELTYSGISALHRKKEWLATRALLNELMGEPAQINYYSDGRPYLENSHTNISISHTKGFVSIMLHPSHLPGIDIELISREVGKVSGRFLSSEEISFCLEKTGNSNLYYLIHWCAKEAIFKMLPFSNIEFAEDISIIIADISMDNGTIEGVFNGKSGQVPIPLNYLLFNGIIVVWGSIDNINLTG